MEMAVDIERKRLGARALFRARHVAVLTAACKVGSLPKQSGLSLKLAVGRLQFTLNTQYLHKTMNVPTCIIIIITIIIVCIYTLHCSSSHPGQIMICIARNHS
jgi:hypothetical protein